METHQRALLLKCTSEKRLSVPTQQEIALIIQRARIEHGHSEAEKKAKEIRELIESGITEQELMIFL